MTKPNAEKHNPDPAYLRSLIEGAGISQREASRIIGINERTMRFYLQGKYDCPYTVQFALENL